MEHHVGVYHAGEVVGDVFDHDDDASQFDASAGAARRGADDNEDEGEHADDKRPMGRHGHVVSAGGHGGSDMEDAEMQRIAEAVAFEEEGCGA